MFDFGGVLIHWDPRRLYRKLFPGDEAGMENFLEEINFNEWNLRQDAGRPFSVVVAELAGRFPRYADLIRAYDERWAEVHMHPEEVLQAFKDLRGRWLVPIHNGTFDLGLHPWKEPFERLSALAQADGNTQLAWPGVGERLSLAQPGSAPGAAEKAPWWRDLR